MCINANNSLTSDQYLSKLLCGAPFPPFSQQLGEAEHLQFCESTPEVSTIAIRALLDLYSAIIDMFTDLTERK